MKRLNNWLPIILLLLLLVLLLYGLVYFFILPPNITYPQLPLESPIIVSSDKPLVIRFDRPVSSGINATIVPEVVGYWQPSISSLSFIPRAKLEPGTEYLVNITNLLPLAWFSPAQAKKFSFVFTTQPAPPPIPDSATPTQITLTPTPATETVNLDIPLYKKRYKFTCFNVAAKMALGYRGVEVDEVKFLDEIGYQKTNRNFVTNTWGDPNIGVVGTINGQGAGGYGVHWDPVAKAMSHYAKVEVKRNWNLTELLSTVKAGNPVMVWWVNGVWPAKDISWNNSSGEKIYTVNGMHVEVVRGYQGNPDKPEYIYTNDPWRGKRQYRPEVFNELWKWFNQTAVIVYQ